MRRKYKKKRKKQKFKYKQDEFSDVDNNSSLNETNNLKTLKESDKTLNNIGFNDNCIRDRLIKWSVKHLISNRTSPNFTSNRTEHIKQRQLIEKNT